MTGDDDRLAERSMLSVGGQACTVAFPTDAVAVLTAPCLGGLRLDLLHAFVVLADALHFTRAAERCFLSQSGLSRRISLLEAQVGSPLVLRTTRSVELTAAGRAVLPHAIGILRGAQAIRSAAQEPAPVGRQPFVPRQRE